MLRIGDFGFARVESKERSVKQIYVFKYGPGLDVVGMLKDCGFDSRSLKLFIRKEGDRFDATRQVTPKGIEIRCAGKTPAHSYYGNVIECFMEIRVTHELAFLVLASWLRRTSACFCLSACRRICSKSVFSGGST